MQICYIDLVMGKSTLLYCEIEQKKRCGWDSLVFSLIQQLQVWSDPIQSLLQRSLQLIKFPLRFGNLIA